MAASVTAASSAAADVVPYPPCGAGSPVPAYAPVGVPPGSVIAHDVTMAFPDGCTGAPTGKLPLALALAGRIDGRRTLEDFAGRIGAVSAMNGIRYWSVSDGEWRDLVDDASALTGPDADRRRPDFMATEILSSKTLYLAIDDTRSTGSNVFELTVHRAGPDRLTVTMTNLSALGFGPFTIFAPRTLRATQFVSRLADGSWGYYALWTVGTDAVDDADKSFLNRANALFRFIADIPTDREPPLAR